MGRKVKIWRRLLVPSNYNFHQLHVAIQKCMPWESAEIDYHLHKFVVKNPESGENDEIMIGENVHLYKDLADGEVLDEIHVGITDYFHNIGDMGQYEYDFGIGWQHCIILEKVSDVLPGVVYPQCIEWQGQCPSEDGVADKNRKKFDPKECFGVNCAF